MRMRPLINSRNLEQEASIIHHHPSTTMRVFLLTLLVAVSSAFVQQSSPAASSTQLAMDRREAMKGMVAGMAFLPQAAGAFSQQLDDYAYEPQQQATDGRLDLNSAFVGEYKQLRGMFPHAAGKIASNGPYAQVKDIYKIPDLTSRDRELFAQYQDQFTVHPPGRSFYERINSRVST